ncbi:alpha/beta fold hydrolase [Halobium salinum]|uniref:Alpha/beta fold hydrolase n=1 Tax=Halobium salinum TaxID=1364940 RepID=A0ABD5P9V1_9EURY|nr:alpha/beta hydrolase [Halobium salinum]
MAGETAERDAGALPAGVPGDSVYVETDGVRLHTVQAGPDDGPLVVLLHGFPEFWYAWHEAIRPLTNAGYRVVVPDQRGYNLSDKPPEVRDYAIDELAGDVVGLASELGYDAAHVVGHDWGAAVAWWTALAYPDAVDHLVAAAVPHPSVFRRTLQQSWEQRFRSWYMGFFQLPKLPESTLSAGNYRLLARSMRKSSVPGTFTPADLDRYREAWSQPGALTAMINWYRAAARERPTPPNERVGQPTLVLWGAGEPFLNKSMAWRSVDYCDDGRVHLYDDCTHWLHHEQPVAVAERIVDFLGE